MLPARCLERKLSRAWEQGARSFAECAVCVLCGDARACSFPFPSRTAASFGVLPTVGVLDALLTLRGGVLDEASSARSTTSRRQPILTDGLLTRAATSDIECRVHL